MNLHPPKFIRVLLVDDHFMVRLGLRGSISAEADLEVVGEARNGIEAVEKYSELRPTVTLMDGMLPDIHGVEATRRILAQHADARIILVSINETAEDIHRAMQAGACGYLPKSCEKDALLAAIRLVANGGQYLAPGLAGKLAERNRFTEISLRETEVLQLIARGLTNKEIAAALSISEGTVKTHVVHLLGKLGVSHRAHAVSQAVELGLLRQ